MKFLPKLVVCSIVIASFQNFARAEVVGGFMPLNASWNMYLGVLDDKETDTAHIQISGPSDRWFAVGFNSTAMSETYAIITDGNGAVVERSLGNFSAGSLLASSLTVESSTVLGGVRTLYLTRPRVGITASHYSFSDNEDTINLIYARGNGVNLAYHGPGNRAVQSISKEALPPPEIGIAPHGFEAVELQLANLVFGITNSLQAATSLQNKDWTTTQILKLAPPATASGPIGWLFSTNVTSTATNDTRFFSVGQ